MLSLKKHIYLMQRRLPNVSSKKIAIITGASRGIGAATAKLLATQGYAVCINYNANETAAAQLVQNIQQHGGHALAIQADISIEAEVKRLFNEVDQKLGKVTALVNNAAITNNQGIDELDSILLQQIFATNVYGSFWCCREAIQRMQDQGGAIVNVSSEAAKFGGNRITAYAASKAAISTFTIGLAREVAKYNIRVNAVSPSVIDTEMHQGIPTERLTALQNSIPMGRMGSPTEVAQTIAWLLSDHASYLSGAVIPITGAR